MYTKKRIPLFFLSLCSVLCLLSTFGCSKTTSQSSTLLKQYRSTVADNRYIMHALGGMDGKYSYTNSIDALERTYAEGYRLFEVDVSFTSDNKLVLAHSTNNIWKKADWEQRLGQTYYEGRTIPTYEEFMNFTIQGKFKATSFDELLDFMETHDDMFVMIDGNKRSYEDTVSFYTAIVDSAQGREDVLQHMIVGGQTTDMIDAVRAVYDFPLVNLYYDSDEKREKIIQDPEDFIQYCSDHQILSFSAAADTYTKEVSDILGNSDLISYVFTVNDEAQAQELFDRKTDIVGTDFLRDNT